MHGSKSLARTVSAVVSQPSSRIPHLTFHIFRRRINPPSSRSPRKPSSHCQQRFHSTAVSSSSFKPFDDRVEDDLVTSLAAQDASDTGAAIKPATTSSLSGDDATQSAANVYTVLEGGQPDQILFALLDDTVGTPFIRYAPDEMFEKAILSLDPDYFIEPYKAIYRHIRFERDTGYHTTVRSLKVRTEDLVAHLEQIIAVRREAGFRLTLSTYRHLLKWAASMGNESLARNLLRKVMPQDEIQPDVTCYNYFLHAKNWNKAYTIDGGSNLRVTPRNIEIRGSHQPPPELSGHNTANPTKAYTGIRADVLQIFKQLIEKDLTANEFTFVNMMVAMGRENDMSGVKSILKSVWNVDVDLLLTLDEEEIESPTFYESDSPLRPSDRLLFAIVHIFGSNNDARTAWLLVDYISRNYDLPIPKAVWLHLLEWYMLLSLQRSPHEKNLGRGLGHLPAGVFEQLYSVMIDEPHNVEPDGPMQYLLSRIHRNQRHLNREIDTVRDLKTSLSELRNILDQWTQRVETFLVEYKKAPTLSLWDSKTFFEIRRGFLLAVFHFYVHLFALRRAVKRNLLQDRYWAESKRWQRQTLPQMIEEFREFLPNVLIYHTETGLVELDCQDHRDELIAQQHGSYFRNVNFIRQMLDSEKDATALQSRTNVLLRRLPCARCNSLSHYTIQCHHSHPQPAILANFKKSIDEIYANKRKVQDP